MNSEFKVIKRDSNNYLIDLISFGNGDVFFGRVVQFLDYKDLGRVRKCSQPLWKMLEKFYKECKLAYRKVEQLKLLEVIRDIHNECRVKIDSKVPSDLSEVVPLFEFYGHDLKKLLNHQEGVYSMLIMNGLGQVDVTNPLMINPFTVKLLREVAAVEIQHVKAHFFEHLLFLIERAAVENLECFKLLKQLFLSLFDFITKQDYECFRQIFIRMQCEFENYQKFMYDGEGIVNIYATHFNYIFETEFVNQNDRINLKFNKLKSAIKRKIRK